MRISVNENRKIVVEANKGIIGENNATIIDFTFPDTIASYPIEELNKYIIFDKEEVSPQLIENNRYIISDVLTQEKSLIAQIWIKKDEVMLFKSEIFELSFNDTLKVSYTVSVEDIDIINTLITQYNTLKSNFEIDNSTLQTEISNLQDVISTEIQNENTRNTVYTTLVENMNRLITNLNKTKEDLNQYILDSKEEFEEYKTRKDKQITDYLDNIIKKMDMNIDDKGRLEVSLYE